MLGKVQINLEDLLLAYQKMCWVHYLALTYETHRDICKIVHSTSRGHEAIQLALAWHLKPIDYIYPYYRDESVLLGIGMTPYQMILQLLAKKEDPFSGGRMYYAHPSLRDEDKPKIPYQSSATGMQAIPSTGAAHGIKYKEKQQLFSSDEELPIVICSLGDGAITEGEVSESFQEAVLHKLPIIYVIQDNGWSISAKSPEFTAMSPIEFAKGFKGLETISVDGWDFIECYETMRKTVETVRKERRPFMVHAKVPLLHHHTSGVRKEWYRDPEDLAQLSQICPRFTLKNQLLSIGIEESVLNEIENEAEKYIAEEFQKAIQAEEPALESLFEHVYAPTLITEEKGERTPKDGKEVVMVDAALHALEELMKVYPELVFYGQDVGGELGGVFREAALLAKKFGDSRVFNTPIQEAYIIGSTAGMSAVGCKPVVEVQFADYIWPGLNQLFTELSRSCYLSNGKWPVQSLIRVPIGAYGGGGPFHSSSVESVLCNIKGIKVVYPSNAADLKGLFKAAFLDPNPVVMLEHKGLYWSKVPGSKAARTIEPDENYVIPLGKGRVFLEASQEAIDNGESCLVVTYGMGVHWALNAAQKFHQQVEILDLRTLMPVDWDLISERVKVHNKVLVVTEESTVNTYAEALAGRIGREFFKFLDAPVKVIGSENVPAIPVNMNLEAFMLPNADKVAQVIQEILDF